MATQKKSTSSGSTSTALVKWRDRLATHAAAAKAVTKKALGKFIGTRGGIFTIDQKKCGSNLGSVVIRHTFENAMYEGKFDPENPESPICFALGDNYDELAPHADSVKPQSKTCADCPMNEFGSADTGKGKACRNIRRLAVISEDAIEGDIESAEVHYLRVPVTSAQSWDSYVNDLADTLGLPPFALVTEIGLVPDEKTQMKMTFRIKKESAANGVVDDDESLESLEKLHLAQADKIDFPYPKFDEDQKPKKTSRSGASSPARQKFAPRPANTPVTRTAGRK